ncbi:hypothetical protein Syun_003493 [Stephania yunnanensis]|uniref:Uncharacterized protein n=1 Tax=Stephania yunnanensis TaxID=152371 RepID=A0AAP0L1E4_9MAGN
MKTPNGNEPACVANVTLWVAYLSFCAVASQPPFSCDPQDATLRNPTFCKASLHIAIRVRDLIGRMTLQEKISLLIDNAAAVPRLGIRGYEWWSEELHGVSDVSPGTKFGGQFPGTTSFPQVIAIAASFNTSLWEEIGRVSAQLGTVTRLPVHPASPVLLTKNGPLGALDSLARLNEAAMPSYLFKV